MVINAETVELTIKLDFKDNDSLQKLKQCIENQQIDSYELICKEMKKHLDDKNVMLLYKFQTVRVNNFLIFKLSKLLLEVKNDTFNHDFFSLIVLPSIAVWAEDKAYSKQDFEENSKLMLSLLQLCQEVIRGWAHFFPQTPLLKHSKFIEIYLNLKQTKNVVFKRNGYYPEDVIVQNTDQFYLEIKKIILEQLRSNILKSSQINPPEEHFSEIAILKQILASTQQLLSNSLQENDGLQEKISQQKTKYCELFRAYLGVKEELKSRGKVKINYQPEDQILKDEIQRLILENDQLRLEQSQYQKKIDEMIVKYQCQQKQFSDLIEEQNGKNSKLQQEILHLNKSLSDQQQSQMNLQFELKRSTSFRPQKEQITVEQHTMQIQAIQLSHQQQISSKCQEINNLRQELEQQIEKATMFQNSIESNKINFQQLSKDYSKTITQQQLQITQLKDQILKQSDDINSQQQSLIKENINLKQEINKHFEKQQEFENNIHDLKKQCGILQQKLSLEKDSKYFMAVRQGEKKTVNISQQFYINTTKNVKLNESREGTEYRSLNHSLSIFPQSPKQQLSPNARQFFPTHHDLKEPKFYNRSSMAKSSITIKQGNSYLSKITLLNGEGIFHADKNFSFGRKQSMFQSSLSCAIYLQNISGQIIKGLTVKYWSTLNNMFLQQFQNTPIQNILQNGEQTSFSVSNINISDIMNRQISLTIQIESTSIHSYEISVHFAITQLVVYHEISQEDFSSKWQQDGRTVTSKKFKKKLNLSSNEIHSVIPYSLSINSDILLFGSLENYFFCCKIIFFEDDQMIITVKDLSNNNELANKLLITYSEIFSE